MSHDQQRLADYLAHILEAIERSCMAASVSFLPRSARHLYWRPLPGSVQYT